MSHRYVDVEALASVTNGTQTDCGLRHIPTGQYLRVNNYRGWAEYSVGDVPTIRTKSTMAYWLNRMQAPEDWEFVTFRLVEDKA